MCCNIGIKCNHIPGAQGAQLLFVLERRQSSCQQLLNMNDELAHEKIQDCGSETRVRNIKFG